MTSILPFIRWCLLLLSTMIITIQTAVAQPSNRGLLWSKLVIAVEELNVREIESLLNQGANPNAHAANGYTPLHIMASVGDKRLVSLLIKRGANLDSVALFGVTAMHIAARYDEAEVIELLAQAGAKIEITDEYKQTPLHTAVFYGNMESTRVLLNYGAKIQASDIEGHTPLHIAAKEGDTEMIDFLVDSGAKIQARDVLGRNALHLAAIGKEFFSARYNKGKVIQTLIRLGANPESQDNFGKIPLDYVSLQEDIVINILTDRLKQYRITD